MAGEEGFEPPQPVLETGGLPLNLLPFNNGQNRRPHENLFHFFVRRVLTAILAKLSRLEPVGMLLPVLRSRVISVFAVVALQRNNFSHMFCSLS